MPRRTLAAFDLKAARKMRGLSQTKTAEILCATQPSVARWEAEGNMPEVFRKVWMLHWQLEAKRNDKPTIRSSGRAQQRNGDVIRKRKRVAGSGKDIRGSEEESKDTLPASDSSAV